MRCDRQGRAVASCRGAKGLVACGCSIAEGGAGMRGRNRGKAPGDPPTGTAGGKGRAIADKERAAIGRCYEVDIYVRVEIDTHGEGAVQGEVTSMLWRGDIGFRQLDAIEVKWNGDTGVLQTGEIEMWKP